MTEYDCEGKAFWVVRRGHSYHLTADAPAHPKTYSWIHDDGWFASHCRQGFDRFTGLRLKNGEARKIRILIVAEE